MPVNLGRYSIKVFSLVLVGLGVGRVREGFTRWAQAATPLDNRTVRVEIT